MATKKPHALLDALLSEHKISTDMELAKQLGMQNSTFSKMRNAGLDTTDVLRVAIMRRFRWSLRRLDELAPPKARGEEGRAD